MKSSHLFPLAAIAAGALFLSSCGDSGSNPTPQPTPSASVPPATTTPTTTPTAAPSTNPSPTPAALCNILQLAPGPVDRYAIAPRQQTTDGQVTDIRVRARPGFDEVWCIDRAKGTHILLFNANQKNADGRECCWQTDPTWTVVSDSANIVTNGSVTGNFIYRLRVDPAGKNGTIQLQSTVDGKASYPWQSNSGYRQEPFVIQSMTADEINRDCRCIYRGNGIYEGAGCSK